ncbi:hypothetical protein DFH09DRAFT_1090056 [Mycena vulgaris]|nr:hypothetical protein DFH09DRAFT_1090056 [Mycena vulgaris]
MKLRTQPDSLTTGLSLNAPLCPTLNCRLFEVQVPPDTESYSQPPTLLPRKPIPSQRVHITSQDYTFSQGNRLERKKVQDEQIDPSQHYSRTILDLDDDSLTEHEENEPAIQTNNKRIRIQ